jgi:hypothetical protein
VPRPPADSPKDRLEDLPKDRRRTRRHPLHGPIDFSVRNWYLRRGRILNLCLDGCLIQPHLATGCTPGDLLDLRFEVNRLAFRAQCTVRRVSPDGLLGVEILRLSDRNRAQLRDLLAEQPPATKPGAPSSSRNG